MYHLVERIDGQIVGELFTEDYSAARRFYNRGAKDVTCVRVYVDGRKLGIAEADKLFLGSDFWAYGMASLREEGERGQADPRQ